MDGCGRRALLALGGLCVLLLSGCAESAVSATRPSGVVYQHSLPAQAVDPALSGQFSVTSSPDKDIALDVWYPDGTPKIKLSSRRDSVLAAIETAVKGIERGRAENFSFVLVTLVQQLQSLSASVIEVQTALQTLRAQQAPAPTPAAANLRQEIFGELWQRLSQELDRRYGPVAQPPPGTQPAGG